MRVPPTTGTISSQPNVTPMIDVMLVLLIIFMVVTPLLADGFRAALPEGVNLSQHLEEEGEAVVGIDDRGRLYLNRRPITDVALSAALEARFKLHPENRVVYLRADRNTEFAKVQEAMDHAERAGARVVGLITVVAEGATQAPR